MQSHLQRHFDSRKFLFRMIRPSVFVFFIGFLLMGLLSRTESVGLPPFQMAQYQYSKVTHELTHIPQACLQSRATSEFQEQQCAEFWKRLAIHSVWALAPFLLVVLFLRISLSTVAGVYRLADTKLRNSQGVFLGVATDPPEMPNDFYGWFHMCRSIAVEVVDRRQVRVYVPLEAPAPAAGTKLIATSVGKRFGHKRYVGIIHAPHIAVIAGTQKK